MQILAASNFVAIPPEPNLFFLLSIKDIIFSLIEVTSLTIFFLFDLSYNPSTSENKISISAPIIWATLAASLSLSPYFISLVAVESFSFTTGIALSLNKLSNVLRTLIALLRCSVSSGLIKIWPVLILYLSNSFWNSPARWIWPTAAIAWLISNLIFPFLIFRYFWPRAIAPDETITKFFPFPYFFISLIREVTHFFLKIPLLSITVADPSFKTILFAFLISIFN